MLIGRPYQLRDLDRLRAAFAQHRSVLYVGVTGSGKTVLASMAMRSAIGRGNRCLFLAGKTELLDQTVDKLNRAEVTDVRVIQAKRDIGPSDAAVTVASIQTITTDRWRDRMPPAELVILDEAQHGPAQTWAGVMRHYEKARWLGLSATPERASGEPLGDLFETLVVGPSVRELIALDCLVPCRIWAGPATLKPGELAMTPLEAYQRFAAGQRAAVFCRDRAHARAELAVFQAAGIPSSVITGEMPASRRRETLAAWRAGDVLAITSVGVLTEGFDLPELGVAILARRFNHPSSYLQAGGRIIRTAPGKTGATLIDLTGCAHEHGPLELDREYSLTGKAIRNAAARDAFGQCRACGTMFLYGPRTCAECGAEIPTRPAVAPRSVGVGVAELGTARPRTPWVSTLKAKRDGYCRKCGRWFPKGTPIFFTQGEAGNARHQICPAPALMSAVEVRP